MSTLTLSSMDINSMYWEEYDDQTTEEFEYIGIKGADNVEALTNIDEQVAELQRLHGHSVQIILYRNR